MNIRSSYLQSVLTPSGWRENVTKVVKTLRPLADRFDAVAFRGMSGSLVAPAVAARLRKHLQAVRKAETSHAWHQVEGAEQIERYVIVDDFVSSGKTILAILGAVGEKCPQAECVGVVCYNTSSLDLTLAAFAGFRGDGALPPLIPSDPFEVRAESVFDVAESYCWVSEWEAKVFGRREGPCLLRAAFPDPAEREAFRSTKHGRQLAVLLHQVRTNKAA